MGDNFNFKNFLFENKLGAYSKAAINEEEHDIESDIKRGAVPGAQPTPIPHRSQYAQVDRADREKAALKRVDFPSDKITDFSKGSEYIKKALTVKGMRDLVLNSNTFEEFAAAIKKRTGGKVSDGVLRKIYNLIKQ